jgi:hypothetical protein
MLRREAYFMLVWNPYQFIECLGVLPVVEEGETSHLFRVEKDGLRLELTVFQYAGDVYPDLYRDGIGEAVFKLRLLDCPGAGYVAGKDGSEQLEFAAAGSFGSRYDGAAPIPMGCRVAVNPHLRIELF